MKSKSKKVVKSKPLKGKAKGRSAKSLERKGVLEKKKPLRTFDLVFQDWSKNLTIATTIESYLSERAVKDLTYLMEGLTQNPKDAKKLVKVLRGIYKDYSMDDLVESLSIIEWRRGR